MIPMSGIGAGIGIGIEGGISTGTVETVKLSVYAIALAVGLHEATHYLIALLLRRRPRLRWVGFDAGGVAVDHDAGEHLTLGDWAIHAGPTAIGLGLAVAYVVAVARWPPLWLWLGWGTYTLVGTRNDLRFREVTSEQLHEGV